MPVQTPAFPCSQRSSRGCNVLEMRTAWKGCCTRGPTDKNLHTSLLRYSRRHGYVSEVAYQLGLKNHFAISSVMLYMKLWNNILVTQRSSLAGTKHLLYYIPHLIISDFVLCLASTTFFCVCFLCVFFFFFVNIPQIQIIGTLTINITPHTSYQNRWCFSNKHASFSYSITKITGTFT